MSNEKMVALIRQGHNEYMEKLYIQNLRFICKIIAQCGIDYRSKPEDYEDAKQNAYFGLAAAVDGFDSDKGYKFLTYAQKYIKRSIWRGMLTYTPIHALDEYNTIKKQISQLTQIKQRTPTRAEIAQYCGLSVDKLNYILWRNTAVKSLYEPVDSEEDILLSDTIQDNSINFEEDIENDDFRAFVRKTVNELPPPSAEIINLRFMQGLSYAKIGKIYNISPERVRQKLRTALKLMRKPSIAKKLIDNHTKFYTHTGIEEFNRTWTSSTEKAVLFRDSLY